MATAHPNQIPNFITASSTKLLRRSMIKNNAKLGATIQYFDIQFAQGKWVAWFYEQVTTVSIEELSDD